MIVHLTETLTSSEMPEALQGLEIEKGVRKNKKRKGKKDEPIGTFTPDATGEPHDFSGDTPISNQQFDSIQT